MKEQTDKKTRQYVTEQQAEHMLKMKEDILNDKLVLVLDDTGKEETKNKRDNKEATSCLEENRVKQAKKNKEHRLSLIQARELVYRFREEYVQTHSLTLSEGMTKEEHELVFYVAPRT